MAVSVHILTAHRHGQTPHKKHVAPDIYLNTATTYSELVPMRNFPPQMPMPLLT